MNIRIHTWNVTSLSPIWTVTSALKGLFPCTLSTFVILLGNRWLSESWSSKRCRIRAWGKLIIKYSLLFFKTVRSENED